MGKVAWDELTEEERSQAYRAERGGRRKRQERSWLSRTRLPCPSPSWICSLLSPCRLSTLYVSGLIQSVRSKQRSLPSWWAADEYVRTCIASKYALLISVTKLEVLKIPGAWGQTPATKDRLTSTFMSTCSRHHMKTWVKSDSKQWLQLQCLSSSSFFFF